MSQPTAASGQLVQDLTSIYTHMHMLHPDLPLPSMTKPNKVWPKRTQAYLSGQHRLNNYASALQHNHVTQRLALLQHHHITRQQPV